MNRSAGFERGLAVCYNTLGNGKVIIREPQGLGLIELVKNWNIWSIGHAKLQERGSDNDGTGSFA
ncbi:hypothetical protein [Paenibacillus jiagnxiensis]|uniref:hypothetical protein n=1 Tax=Paenibacillus jiagnxiensis TaxID=3228926 RepID=UPI0033ADC479